MTLADDEAIVYRGADARTYTDLAPDSEVSLDGHVVRTLPRRGRAPGPRRDRQRRALRRDRVRSRRRRRRVGDLLGRARRTALSRDHERRSDRRHRRIDPDAVVVKGDLTSGGTQDEYDRFLEFYGPAFGDRLLHVRGNHESYHRLPVAAWPDPGAGPAGRHPGRARHVAGRADQRPGLGRAAGVARRARRPGRPTGPGVRPPPRVESRRGRVPTRRTSGSSRTTPRRWPPCSPGARSCSATSPGTPTGTRWCTCPTTGERAVRRGGLRQGLPGVLGRVPGVRGQHHAGPPADLAARRRWPGPSAPAACSPAPIPATPAAAWPTDASAWTCRDRHGPVGATCGSSTSRP